MMTLATQILLPLTLLGWLAAAPAKGRIAFIIQAGAILASLLGLTFAALWAMPPYWVPYLYLFLFAGIVVFHWRSGVMVRAVAHEGLAQTVAIVLVAMLGLVGAGLAGAALLGRIAPEIETVDVAPPFANGTYLVAHGGANEWVNVHLQTLDPDVPRFRPWRGQSRALDLFRITPAGQHMRGGWYPPDPAQYESFGTLLVAPCAGTVALAVDGVVDNAVPTMNRNKMAGNYVAIECAADIFVILAHFRQGSVRVRAGDRVDAGDPLGELGNSGNSSEPHLHIHAQRGLPADAPLGGEPLALTIDGRYLVRNDRIRVP